MLSVGSQYLQDVISLRPAKQLLEPRGISEPLFQRLVLPLAVDERSFAFQPRLLLLRGQELSQAFKIGLGLEHGTFA